MNDTPGLETPVREPSVPPQPARRPGAGPSENRAALGRLLAFLVGALVLAVVFHGLAVLIVVLAFVAMVMLHELGHFATAKWSGMKVTEYFLGFGPRVWSIRRGETTYGVKAIPAGGYVRIIGMTSAEKVDPADEARTFREATFPRRLLVAVAGSSMHFVMAFLLLWGMFSFSGLPVAAPANQISGLTTFVGGSSPAKAAGLRAGDELLGVNGHRYATIHQTITAIESHAGQAISLIVRRGGRVITLRAVPVDGRSAKVLESGTVRVAKSGPKPVGFLGINLGGVNEVTTNPFAAIGRAGSMLGSLTATTATGITKVFSLHGLRDFAHQVAIAGSHGSTSKSSGSGSGSGSGSSNGQIISIVGAIQIGSQAAGQNVSELLYILVAINLFVGMVNLFPMLPLDGGHVVIAIYERARSRKGRRYHADVTKLMPLAYVFLLFMVLVGLGALYANIVNPVSLPGG